MKQDGRLLGYYNYTVILTYIGMIIGFNGVIHAFTGEVHSAIICLMAAGFCDMFDGAIASTKIDRTANEKCFGIQIDSMSDLICFGVLPATILYAISNRSALVLAISSMYLLCTLIRLSYFNVDEQHRQIQSSSSRTIYYGMPVTLAALFVPIAYEISSVFKWRPSISIMCLLFVMGILFLLPFRIKKPQIIGKACILFCGMTEIMLIPFTY